MTSIDDMAAEIMRGLTEYAALADTEMKKAVKKTAAEVKKQISANAPKRTGRYAKSWTTKKTKENSHTLEMTVHSKDRYQLAHLLEKGHAKRNGGRVSGKPHIAPAEGNLRSGSHHHGFHPEAAAEDQPGKGNHGDHHHPPDVRH